MHFRCLSIVPRTLKNTFVHHVPVFGETGAKRFVHLSTVDLKRRKTKEEKVICDNYHNIEYSLVISKYKL